MRHRVKTCWACGQRKSIRAFAHSTGKHGRSNECRQCRQARYQSRLEIERLKQRVRNANNRARRYGRPGVLTLADVVSALLETNGCCWYCGANLDLTGWQLDHVIPLYRPGSMNTRLNIVASCPHCNASKGKRLNWRPEVHTCAPERAA